MPCSESPPGCSARPNEFAAAGAKTAALASVKRGRRSSAPSQEGGARPSRHQVVTSPASKLRLRKAAPLAPSLLHDCEHPGRGRSLRTGPAAHRGKDGAGTGPNTAT
jgi:hypothetical protein